MIVKELTDPKALLRPEVQEILKAAVESGVLLAPYGWDTLANDIYEFVTNPDYFMILGAEDGRFKAVSMGYFTNSNLFPYPTIVLFYNKGSKALRQAVAAKTLDTISGRGYTDALALNGTKHTDAAWVKVLAPEGVTYETVGTLVKLKV